MHNSDTFIMPDGFARGKIEAAPSRPALPEGMKRLSQWTGLDPLQTQNA